MVTLSPASASVNLDADGLPSGAAALKLPVRFDPGRLRDETESIAGSEWQPHFNTGVYTGGWSGVALRAIPGAHIPIYSNPVAGQTWTDTPLLDRLPYLREALAQLHCPLLSARLLKLAPGAVIKEHRDYGLGFDQGEIRLHIVAVTNPWVVNLIGGERQFWAAGECWYGDFSLPHRVENHGAHDRIHIVMDCVLNGWLLDMLARSKASPGLRCGREGP
jgi:hypothetical protein